MNLFSAIDAFIKLAFTIRTRQQALEILGLPISATPAEIKKKYRQKVLELHPDKAENKEEELKLTEEIKLINAAKQYLDENEEDPEIVEPIIIEEEPVEEEIEEPDTDLSYEEIAEMFRELGVDAFKEKYPGWLGELQSELGLDEFNRIFYGMSEEDDEQSRMDYERVDEERAELVRDWAGSVASEIYYELSDELKQKLINMIFSDNFALNNIMAELPDNLYKSVEEYTSRFTGAYKRYYKEFEHEFCKVLQKDLLRDFDWNNFDENFLSKEIFQNLPRSIIFKVFFKIGLDKLKEYYLDDINAGNWFNFNNALKEEIIKYGLAERADFEEICKIIEKPLLDFISKDHRRSIQAYLRYFPVWFLEKLLSIQTPINKSWIERAIREKK